MVLVFLADGFEEIEALTVVDVLRRADLEVVTVGIGDKLIRGAHGILVGADTDDGRIPTKDLQAVVLPGGHAGARCISKSGCRPAHDRIRACKRRAHRRDLCRAVHIGA